MRYVIGIDLGTTNSSVAYVDTQSQNLQIQQFRIPQLVASGYSESLPTLPSFCYLCATEEWAPGSLTLPWKEQLSFFVGQLAQLHGAKVPTRLVQSAKSWLCHAAANRREKILPFEGGDAMFRISPVEASARYLSHLKEAWNHVIAKGDPTQEFESQEITLTVPASFDEISRRLTAEAAAQAGLAHLTLLEEPQAAFYSWLAQNETSWQEQLPLGSRVLVCDVGGGTTDFSLIEVSGTLEHPLLQRMSVGDHLLLGGDNMDAALAHYLSPKLFQDDPSSDEWMRLKSEARRAKESLLEERSLKDSFTITLQGSGAAIVAKSRTAEISREELLKIVLDGFFSQHPWDDAINVRKTSGMRAMGLPYETDPSITKHLARFLAQSPSGEAIKGPDFVLFNGGTMKPLLFQKAILESLEAWFPKVPIQLPSYHLDLAVSRGAAYYGKVRRGIGVKISGGSARGYYFRLDTKEGGGTIVPQALTLLPRGSDEGATYEPQHTFLLRPNTLVAFQLYTSHVRLADQSGDLVPIDLEQLQPLPPIHTILKFGKKQLSGTNESELIPVHLRVHLNAVGTLEVQLRAQQTNHVWNLEFQLRTASGQENSLTALDKGRKDQLYDQSFLAEAKSLLQSAFSSDSTIKPTQIIDLLEKQLQQPRREWAPSLLRGLCDTLLKISPQRKLSQPHEARWWNLIGFFLMPGCGFPMDDFRVKELWKILLSEPKGLPPGETQIQKWICYRRISAGLNKGQQIQLAHELLPLIVNKRNNKIEVKGKADFYPYSEKIRAFASLELIDTAMKEKVGHALLERMTSNEAISPEYWALGRIGARHLLYGSPANVISKQVCSEWITKLLHHSKHASKEKELGFTVRQLARKTDLREINLPKETIEQILRYFATHPEISSLEKALLEVSELSSGEQEQIFGDHLPAGLLHIDV